MLPRCWQCENSWDAVEILTVTQVGFKNRSDGHTRCWKVWQYVHSFRAAVTTWQTDGQKSHICIACHFMETASIYRDCEYRAVCMILKMMMHYQCHASVSAPWPLSRHQCVMLDRSLATATQAMWRPICDAVVDLATSGITGQIRPIKSELWCIMVFEKSLLSSPKWTWQRIYGHKPLTFVSGMMVSFDKNIYVVRFLLHCTLSCGAVYCNRPCLCVCGFVCLFVGLLPR